MIGVSNLLEGGRLSKAEADVSVIARFRIGMFNITNSDLPNWHVRPIRMSFNVQIALSSCGEIKVYAQRELKLRNLLRILANNVITCANRNGHHCQRRILAATRDPSRAVGDE